VDGGSGQVADDGLDEPVSLLGLLVGGVLQERGKGIKTLFFLPRATFVPNTTYLGLPCSQ
jgi:hypothetical protein